MLKRIREMFKNEKGLTLVELLAVIVILAIVGAIAFVMIGNIIENSKKDAAVADALQAVNAAKLYETTGTPAFPVSIENLQKADMLDKLYDPWDKSEYGTASGNQVAKPTTGDNVGEYVVTLDASGCEISGITEAKLIEDGRKVCD